MTNVVSSVGTIGKSFLSTLSLRRATGQKGPAKTAKAFLSTLSLRRATNWSGVPLVGRSHFYPRSPCGERLVHLTQAASPGGISIHALLAESDGIQAETAVFVPPISIHALLAESDKNTSIAGRITEISIHALLAESDNQCKIDQKRSSNFYPRSPCGERQSSGWGIPNWESISIHALLAESDLPTASAWTLGGVFLSTLSLRRATRLIYRYGYGRGHFYPRSPCGERHLQPGYLALIHSISIHALLAESDSLRPCMPTAPPCISIHALLAESAIGNFDELFANVKFLSTLSLRRATCSFRPAPWSHYHFYPRSPCGERP